MRPRESRQCPVVGMYIDIDYVIRDWLKEGNAWRGSEGIKESRNRNFYLNGAIQPGEERRLWMWTQPKDEYISGEFRDRVMAGTHDGRAVMIPLRKTGERVMTLTPLIP